MKEKLKRENLKQTTAVRNLEDMILSEKEILVNLSHFLMTIIPHFSNTQLDTLREGINKEFEFRISHYTDDTDKSSGDFCDDEEVSYNE